MKKHNTISDMILGLFSTEKIHDPMFGELALSRTSSSRGWSTTTVFPPTGESVVLVFRDLDRGVPDATKAFYRELIEKYEELRPSIAKTLADVYRNDVGPISSEDVWSVFTIVSIDLPTEAQIGEGKADWVINISYDANHPKKTFNVDFENWNIVEFFSGEGSQ